MASDGHDGGAHRARISGTGYGFLTADTGFDLLGRYLAAPGESEVAILSADFDKLAELPGAAQLWPASALGFTKSRSTSTVPTQATQPKLPSLAGELLALKHKAATELLQDYLTQIVAAMTSPASNEHTDIETGFLDMGIDSLAALELRKKLETALGLKLKSTLILDYPNILLMAQELIIQVQKSHSSETGQAEADVPAKSDRSDLLRQLANEIDLQE